MCRPLNRYPKQEEFSTDSVQFGARQVSPVGLSILVIPTNVKIKVRKISPSLSSGALDPLISGGIPSVLMLRTKSCSLKDVLKDLRILSINKNDYSKSARPSLINQWRSGTRSASLNLPDFSITRTETLEHHVR